MDCNKKTFKNFSGLAYKILNDILALLLIAFSLFLLAESALPGIISSSSSHLSFLKLTLIIFAVLGLVIFLGRKNDFQFSASDKKNPPIRRTGLPTNKRAWKIFFALTIFFLALIANSLFKFSPWEILIITPFSCFVLIYSYKILFTP